MSEFRVVFCTIDTIERAKQLAHELVKNRLAACVNIIPRGTSIYEWKGEIVEDKEFLLIIKTKATLYSKLETKIKELHPYEVPEIVSLNLEEGSKDYLDWIKDNTL